MSFTEFEMLKHEEVLKLYIEKIRPKVEIRNEIDIEYRIHNQSIEIIEKRRTGRKLIESPVAKTTYIRSRDKWRIYWQKADMKWHVYEPQVEAKTLKKVIEIIERDEYGCFWG